MPEKLGGPFLAQADRHERLAPNMYVRDMLGYTGIM